MMSKSKKLIFGLFGAIVGLCIGSFLNNFNNTEIVSKCDTNSLASVQYKSPLEIINLTSDETTTNSQRNLVFVGVMTSQDFLNSRAKAVYNTWGKQAPGRIAFFSSEGSISDELPLIALNGVDDRYPPQKKSFMMLHYMYEHFLDKFEWFLRADDDVFIKPDKLEKFLRSIDSSKPQFIGQAGRGNNEELFLEMDENFCMGGPGIILSRQTLRRVAPHIAKCLKNLYSNHEDVEIGRCVQKFAGLPCTWNYEMQSIFHHNSSGYRAFSGNLKNKEVHSAFTLHPIKRAPLMYRLHAYNMGLTAQELRQQSLFLHRNIAQMINLLQIPKTHKMLTRGVPLFPESDNDSYFFLDDHDILGNNPNLNRHMPDSLEEVIEWDFLAKSVYSASHTNPKRKMESSLREGLDDVIREIMENINNYSRQRGRLIEYRDLLYGYSRVNPMYGHDLVLDLLLVYKKYRGKKMTVPVRKHLYIQRSFTETRIREITNNPEIMELGANNHSTVKFTEKVKSMFKMNKINELYSNALKRPKSQVGKREVPDKIVFVLPLSGRYEIFLRFLNNFEDVVLKNNENVELLISYFVSNFDPKVSNIYQIIELLNQKYPQKSINIIKLYGEFSRGVAIDKAVHSNFISDNDIIFFIDVDILFRPLAFSRIRQNTIRNQQIYLPIVFSEYNPVLVQDSSSKSSNNSTIPWYSSSLAFNSIPMLPNDGEFTSDYRDMLLNYRHYDNFTINNDNGYFREFGYGLASIYKCDILNSKINGFVTDVKGWGLEDVKFLEKIIHSSYHVQNQILLNIADGKSDQDSSDLTNINLNVFRSPDQSLIHIFHRIVCDQNLDKDQYRMCLGTRANTLGSHKLMKQKYFYEKDFLQFVKQVKEIVVS